MRSDCCISVVSTVSESETETPWKEANSFAFFPSKKQLGHNYNALAQEVRRIGNWSILTYCLLYSAAQIHAVIRFFYCSHSLIV